MINSLMADLNWYRSFVAVYRSGKVSSAANLRNLTQPAITQHIASLEQVTGEALFTRTPKGMTLTERGKALYAQVVESLDRLERVSRTLRPRTSHEAVCVRLGAPIEFFYEVALGRLIDARFRLEVRFNETRELIQALEEAKLDAVIATQRLSTRALEYQPIFDETFVLVGSPSLFAPSDTALEAWLNAQRWVSYGPDLPIIRRFYRANFERRPGMEPALIVPDLRAALRAVELGAFVSVLPDYLCQDAIQQGRVQVLMESIGERNTLWLVRRKTDLERPELQELEARLLGNSPSA
jgi:DNA-binding transcriptional LysR family regulator